MATPSSAGLVTPITYSSDSDVNALLDDYKWSNPMSLTYSFQSTGSYYSQDGVDYGTKPGSGEPWGNWYQITSAQKTAFAKALAAWADVANLDFTKVTDSDTLAGDIRVGYTDHTTPGDDAPAWAWFPYASAKGGDIWLNMDSFNDIGTAAKGTYGFELFLHEIGHALGLKHPHQDAVTLPTSTDWVGFTVMSYRDYAGDNLNSLGSTLLPSTPMLYDIAAIQYLYGANYSTRSGNTTYSWNVGEQIYETIWDGGGKDTIDWSNQSSAAIINLTSGHWSYLGPQRWDSSGYTTQNLNIAFNCTIENANGGSASDNITGNTAANVLYGNAGFDTLSGGGGADSLEGGPNDDRMLGGKGNDRFDWESSTRTGNDTMIGGAGNDVYVIDSLGDKIQESSGGGAHDLVWASFTYSLASAPNVEDLAIFGSSTANATGSSAGNTLAGNAAVNILSGLGGNDVLVGGKGDDKLIGGGGKDKFTFDKALNASTNVDLIQDFVSGTDKLWLDDDIFKGMGQGHTRNLEQSAFYVGSKAHDANDHIIYERSSGTLYYDPDGQGGATKIAFATLGSSSHPVLHYTDIQLIG